MYVRVPSQLVKLPPTVGPTGVMALPQASVTAGGVGGVALAIQATVELPLAGMVKSSRSMV